MADGSCTLKPLLLLVSSEKSQYPDGGSGRYTSSMLHRRRKKCGLKTHALRALSTAAMTRLYFPVVCNKAARVPLKTQERSPLWGCHIMAVKDSGGRPRIPAFKDPAHAKAVLEAAKSTSVAYVIGDKLVYEISRVPDDADTAFVYLADPRDIARTIGTHVCDVCEYEEDSVFVRTSLSMQVPEPDLAAFRKTLE